MPPVHPSGLQNSAAGTWNESRKVPSALSGVALPKRFLLSPRRRLKEAGPGHTRGLALLQGLQEAGDRGSLALMWWRGKRSHDCPGQVRGRHWLLPVVQSAGSPVNPGDCDAYSDLPCDSRWASGTGARNKLRGRLDEAPDGGGSR